MKSKISSLSWDFCYFQLVALNSLLEEIRSSNDARILRAAVADDSRRSRLGGRPDPKSSTRQPWSL